MRISDETIAAIQEVVQVEEVLADYVDLQKKGKKYLCPFHEDHNPSLSITPDGKFYKCFSCDAKGNAVSYLMEEQGLSYPEAMHHLARKYGIPWQVEEEEEGSEATQEREALLILLRKAQDYFVHNLHHLPENPALAYLTKRSLASTPLLKKFSLGYSLPEWQGLLNHAGKQGYDASLLVEAGLALKKEGKEGSYDRFRGRLIFPIHDVGGQVIGFGARRMEADEKSPKYINSPETPVYQKSKVLYGLYQAKKTIKSEKNCFLVEGYTDVLAMHEAGLSNAVASGGTALTREQVRLLKRYGQDVTLLFDGDSAGQAAALRGLDLLLEEGLDVKIVSLPAQEDPDSYRRTHGGPALKEYLKDQAKDLVIFKGTTLFEQAGMDIQKRATATSELVETIARIPDAVKRAFYLQWCAQSLGLSEELLQKKIQYKRKEGQRTLSTRFQLPKRPKKQSGAIPHLERVLLYTLLHYSETPFSPEQKIADYLFASLSEFTFSEQSSQRLWDRFRSQWQSNPGLTAQSFLSLQPKEMVTTAEELMEEPFNSSHNKKPSASSWKRFDVTVRSEEETIARNTEKNVRRLQLEILSKEINQEMEKLRQAIGGQAEQKHLDKMAQLQEDWRKLAGGLSRVVTPSTLFTS